LLIAVARLFLALTSFLALTVDNTEPARLAFATRLLLLIYIAYSAAVLMFERQAKRSAHQDLLLHIGDVVWAVAITSVTEGPNSPFFVFFLFVLMAAAYRWDMRRVMQTAACLTALVGAQALTLRIPAVHQYLGADYDSNRLIMRTAYLLVGGVVIGYIGDNEKRLIREAGFVGKLVSIPRLEIGFMRSSRRVFLELGRYLRAPQAAMLIHIRGGNTYFTRLAEGDPEPAELATLASSEADPWLFSIPANCAWVVMSHGKANVLNRNARWRSPQTRGEVELPLQFVESNVFDDLLLANLVMGEDWTARMVFFDPRPRSEPYSALQLLDRIVREVTPAIHNAYLLKHVRERAQAVQRTRLAHTLHDGPVQSLVAARLQLEALQRRYALPDDAVEDLRRTQEVIRLEMQKLRATIEDLSARSSERSAAAEDKSKPANPKQ
jgi:signal transduction histidine kinase